MRMRDSNETEVSEEQIGEGNDEDPLCLRLKFLL